MWPLYDDLHYRIRRPRRCRKPLAAVASKPEAPRLREIEVVDVRSPWSARRRERARAGEPAPRRARRGD
jgi:hypothetical protein